jgi:hypothetical protein
VHGLFSPLHVVRVLSSGSIHGVSQGRSELQMALQYCVPAQTAGGDSGTKNDHSGQVLMSSWDGNTFQ